MKEYAIEYAKYGNGRVAVLIVEAGEPYCTLSTNVPNEPLEDREFVLKDYSENARIAAQVKRLGIFEYTGKTARMGCSVYRVPENAPTSFKA